MSTPLVSIAMPFYNAERTIGASIRSMLLQTYPNWELLLCDDGSTDASRELAVSFDDPRIVVWGDQQRMQLGARLNECIDRARGEYLARMDADDIAYPRRLEKQLRFLADHPDVDLTGGCAVVFADGGAPVGKRNYPAAHADIARRPLHWFKLLHPTFMGKTSWFRRYRYRADAIRCEDLDLLFRARASSRFANLPEIVLGYRQGFLDLRKCLRGRWMWFHCSGRYLSGAERLRVGAVEAFNQELLGRFGGGGACACRMAALALWCAHRGGIAGMAAGMGLGVMNATTRQAEACPTVWPAPDYGTIADSVRDLFRFLGLDAANPLSRWINACDIFVMPTRELETFGMAAVEAQACGKPVVASDHGGLRETVPETAGARFRTGDAADLAAHLEALLDKPDLLGTLGAGGRENAARYDWPRIVQRCQEVYATL